MSLDISALALAKKYTDKSISGVDGKLLGKNCKIISIVDDDNGNHTVTFGWTDDDGTEKTSVMIVKDGEDGSDVTVPTKISQLKNDSNFITASDLPTSLPASDVHDWAKANTKPTYTANEVGALPETVMSDIENLVSTLEYVVSENILDRSAFVDGYYKSGVWKESTDYVTSDWIEVSEGETIYSYVYSSSNLTLTQTANSYWYEFDENKKYISRQDGGSTLVVPNGIKYIRVMVIKTVYTNRLYMMMSKQVATSYQEYFMPYYRTNISKDELIKILGYKPGVYQESTISKQGDVITITFQKSRYTFQRFVSSSVNIDTWRLIAGYFLDANKRTHTIWSYTDAEGAIKVSGEDDFVGGFHGDEIMESCRIFVDGVEIDLAQDFSDTEFKEVNIYVKSNLYHCNTSELATTLLFKRNKHLKFHKDTVEVENCFVVEDAVAIDTAAICLFQCLKTDKDGNQMLNSFSVNTDCDIYDISLTEKTAIPSASKKMNRAQINTTYGSVDFCSLDSSAQNYLGYVTDYTDQNRMKWYFNTISGSTNVNVGDVISSRFKWSIQ